MKSTAARVCTHSLLLVAVACGGKSASDTQARDDSRADASSNGASATESGEANAANATLTSLDASSDPGTSALDPVDPLDASAIRDASALVPTASVLDAGELVPVATASGPSSSSPTGSSTTPSATPSTTPSGTTPAPTLTAPEPEPPSIDWSTLPVPEGCEVESTSGSNAETCALDLICDGVYRSHTRCDANGCYCQESTLAWDMQVEGGEFIDICAAAVDFCEPPNAEEVDALDCTPTQGSGAELSCSAAQDCSREQEYSSGVRVSVTTTESTECSFEQSSLAGQHGLWQCLCIRDFTSFATLAIPEANPTLDVCTHAERLCLRAQKIVQAAGTQCDVTSESVGADYCYGSSTCLVAGTIAGEPVFTPHTLLVSCNPGADGEVDCTVDGPLGLSAHTIAQPPAMQDACRGLARDAIAELDALVPVDSDAGVDALDAGMNGDDASQSGRDAG
ncbi:MAG TPA: hypothetical protein VHM70_05355 [Polyangiaceae bacterium]|jgi:hypothetical protein|nr:hypothetical protein [Polyangiaceae bacterium]